MKNKLVLTTLLVSASCCGAASADNAPSAVERTAIPACTVFVDAASAADKGTAQQPHRTIAAAVAAAPDGAVGCACDSACVSGDR